MSPRDPSVSISPLLGLQHIPPSLTSFCFLHGPWGSNPGLCGKHFTYWVILQLPDLVFFRGLTVARLISKLTQEESTFIQIQQYWPWIDIDWHMEKAQGILSTDPRRGQSILPSFLALFFIWGLERVAARGRKPFETWSSSNWDKLKEMLLCRVESDLRECYIPKAKGWEYTQIKNTSDILINYVYENNPNGRQYGNS